MKGFTIAEAGHVAVLEVPQNISAQSSAVPINPAFSMLLSIALLSLIAVAAPLWSAQAFAQGGVIAPKGVIGRNGVLGAGRAATVPVFIQAEGADGISGGTGVAFDSNVTVGHVVYAWVFDGEGASETIAISDSQGNSFSVITTQNLAVDGDTLALGCAVVGTTGADTIHWTMNGLGTSSDSMALVKEYSGSTCTLDTTTSPSGGFTYNNPPSITTPVSTGNITTTTNGDLMLMYGVNVHQQNGPPPLNMVAGSGFGNLTCVVYDAAAGALNCSPASVGNIAGAEDNVLSVAGTTAGSITISNPGTAMEWGILYAAFTHQ